MSEIPPKTTADDAIDILLVEDNPGDVRLTQEAFKTADHEVTLQTVANGDDAVEFLRQSAESSLPDLVLLDLNLPGRHGCEVLEEMRDDPQLNPLPVIVLTSSNAEEDIVRCYDASVNAYLTKPTAPDEFISLIDSIEEFWLRKAELPPIPP